MAYAGDPSTGIDPSILAAVKEVMERVDGLEAVCVSNLFGLPVIRVLSADARRPVVEQAEALFAHVFYTAAELAERTPTKRADMITTMWEDAALVQAAIYPLALGLVGRADANVGLMRAAVPQLKKLLEPVRSTAEGYGAE